MSIKNNILELQDNLAKLSYEKLVYLSGVVDGLLGRDQLATAEGSEDK